MEKINWGIIGTGRIAHAFATALAAVPDAELYAVGSRSADKSAAFAEEFGFTTSYGSYDDLLSDDNINIVYIATPMSAHYETCMSALAKGRNVFCEKSVTLNAEQLRDILALADEKKLFFCEAMWMKCRPTYLKMKELISSGRYPMYQGRFQQPRPLRRKRPPVPCRLRRRGSSRRDSLPAYPRPRPPRRA